MIVIRRLVALALALIAFGSPASPRLAAAANESTTFVLHAIDGGPANGCATPGEAGFDCAGVPATVTVASGARADIYLFLRNHDEVSSLECAFDWPADWSYLGWSGGCTGAPTRVPGSHRGRVCVGPRGVDVCAPAPVSVATWGRIKATYGGGG